MRNRTKQIVAIGVFAVVLAVGAGVAIAGGGLGSGDGQKAFLDNAAKRLGVTSEQLQAALQGARGDQLDAAVAAGKISQEKADAMKKRLAEGGPLRFGKHQKGGFGKRGIVGPDAATAYLGLTHEQLGAELRAGKTLADVAKANGKSVDGLKAALKAGVQEKLDAALKAGKLTQAQAAAKQAWIDQKIDDLVNGVGKLGRHGKGHGFGGPPPVGSQPSAFAPISAGSPA